MSEMYLEMWFAYWTFILLNLFMEHYVYSPPEFTHFKSFRLIHIFSKHENYYFSNITIWIGMLDRFAYWNIVIIRPVCEPQQYYN